MKIGRVDDHSIDVKSRFATHEASSSGRTSYTYRNGIRILPPLRTSP